MQQRCKAMQQRCKAMQQRCKAMQQRCKAMQQRCKAMHQRCKAMQQRCKAMQQRCKSRDLCVHRSLVREVRRGQNNRLFAEVGKRGRGKGERFCIFPFPFDLFPSIARVEKAIDCKRSNVQLHRELL
jgi:exonuclease VII large subunit